MNNKNLPAVFKVLRTEFKRFKTPYVTEVAAELRKDPFRVLISCIISLRTKDETTRQAGRRLFERASTPEAIAALGAREIEKLIYPAGFYRVKARTIKEISGRIIADYGGRVPDTIDGLLTLKGVGRKTANLVVTMGFGLPGICVDVHVHRITNRWGYVSTKNPEATEMELRRILPKRYWLPINDLLVAYGQNLCTPVSPRCSICKISGYCERRGVVKSR